MASIMSLSANAVARPVGCARRSTVRASAAPKGVQQPTSAPQSQKSVSMGRRDAVVLGTSALQLLMASKAWALIPGNDEDDEE